MKRIPLLLALAIGLAGFAGTGICVAATPKPSKNECEQHREAREKENAESRQAPQGPAGPLPENWQELVKDAISKDLRDPYSAQFRFEKEPRRTSVFSMPSAQEIVADKFSAACERIGVKLPIKTTWMSVWEAHVNVNAKNAFGAFTGYAEYAVSIQDGKVIKIDQSIGQFLKETSR